MKGVSIMNLKWSITEGVDKHSGGWRDRIASAVCLASNHPAIDSELRPVYAAQVSSVAWEFMSELSGDLLRSISECEYKVGEWGGNADDSDREELVIRFNFGGCNGPQISASVFAYYPPFTVDPTCCVSYECSVGGAYSKCEGGSVPYMASEFEKLFRKLRDEIENAPTAQEEGQS